jgi:hypothetical protein
MKKYNGVFGLLAFILMAALLMGCGSSGGETTTTTSSIFTQSQTQTQTTTTTTQTQTQTTTTTTQTQTQTQTTLSLADILAQAMTHTSVYYEMVTTSPGQPTITLMCWTKGAKNRMEVASTGVVTFIDLTAQTMYIYEPTTNMLYMMQYDPSLVTLDPAFILENSPEIIGEETIDGKDCVIIQYTYQGVVTKAWIWKDTGFPLKMEMTANGITATTILQNFSFADIDDSVFEMPDVAIIDMSSFTQLPF